MCFCFRVINEYERAVIFRLGRSSSENEKGPGLFFVVPCIDKITIIDLRTITFDVPPQVSYLFIHLYVTLKHSYLKEVLTKDSVTVSVDAVVYFKIFNPTRSVNMVANAKHSTRLLAATTLRNILGMKTLQEILTDKESISLHLQELLDVYIFF
jgi:erythrocyte band 7 integral membrane protein